MKSSSTNIAKSLSMLTLMIAGGVAGTACAADGQAVSTSAQAIADAPQLQLSTSVVNTDIDDAKAATYLAARHDDDDTLVEHHHVSSANVAATAAPTAFVV